MKVLLDTDPGSDIDDAVALAYLASHPQCDLLGVTTVTGDVAQRAAICEVVLRACGREDVPVVAGASDVLLDGVGQPHVPHYASIEHLPHRLDRRAYQAVDFLRETILANSGQVTLLTIGPLTNIAALFLLDPGIHAHLRSVVSMVGRFDFRTFDSRRREAEWNAYVDPLATAIFFDRCRCPLTAIPLDVTLECQQGPDEVRARFASPPLDVVLRMAEKWFEHAGTITFHDPLAAALVFDDTLCTYAHGQIEADRRIGATWLREGAGPHRVAKTVDANRFFADYYGVFA